MKLNKKTEQLIKLRAAELKKLYETINLSTYIFYCIWNFLEKWNFCWNYDNFNVKHASYNYNVI